MWWNNEIRDIADEVENLEEFLRVNAEFSEQRQKEVDGFFAAIKHELKCADDALEGADGEIKELESRVDDLEEKLEKAEEKVTGRLALFADPNNWNGRTWEPVMAMYADPVELAERGVVI